MNNAGEQRFTRRRMTVGALAPSGVPAWEIEQYSCAPLPADGQIDVQWRKDGAYSTFNSGTNQQSWGPYTFKSQGTYRSTSARGSGSVLGLSFSDAYGYFGDTRGTNVTRSVSLTPNP